MSINTTTVQAFEVRPHRWEGTELLPVYFDSDNVGAIDTSLKLPDIQKAIEEVCVNLAYSMALKDNILSSKYLRVNFLTADPERLYFALSKLVERRIINYNPATLEGILFGTEPCQE